MEFTIGGIAIALLVVGIVEAGKEFGIDGKASRALALGSGAVLTGLAYSFSEGLIPPEVAIWIEVMVTALAGGLAAMGYYDLGKRLAGRGKQL